ncbi:response regulator [Roseofilum sp. Belize Diploria]|uniref:response regulator n=1 Tax=Roseofilum sp. Belize Diploria TaxID=2821501 RepID=UPI001B19665D|nr:response regulator [Roseofilum sp. Belize Diploria]MBP0008163.1 response regulator [Roseofilum sp. Belize Diploria]
MLVVDDIVSNRELIRGYFRDTAHTLLFAEDGEEAIRVTFNHFPDLILLDLRMPRMNGREVANFLKESQQTQHIPIVIVTASSEFKDEQQLKSICEGFVLKPVKISDLIRVLQSLLPPSQELDSSSSPNDIAPVNPEVNSFEPALTPVHLAELLEKLTILKKNSWVSLSETLEIEEVERFVEDLQALTIQYYYLPLVNYIQNLEKQLDNFDWDMIPQTILKFKTLLESVAEEVD